MKNNVFILFTLFLYANVVFAQPKCVSLFEQTKKDFVIADSGLKDFFEEIEQSSGNTKLLNKIKNHDGGQRFLDKSHIQSSKPTGLMKIVGSFGNIFSIRDYTGSGFLETNQALRDGASIDSPQCLNCRKLVNTLKRLPSYEGYVFRAVNNFSSFKAQFEKVMQEGNVFADPAFVSTSRLIEGVIDWHPTESALLIIHSRNGKSIESAARLKEHEVLFMPGAKFRVDMATQLPDGAPLILLTEVE